MADYSPGEPIGPGDGCGGAASKGQTAAAEHGDGRTKEASSEQTQDELRAGPSGGGGEEFPGKFPVTKIAKKITKTANSVLFLSCVFQGW